MAPKRISIPKLHRDAMRALREAVRDVIEDHKRTGRPLAVWRNGKVVKIPAAQLFRKRKLKSAK